MTFSILIFGLIVNECPLPPFRNSCCVLHAEKTKGTSGFNPIFVLLEKQFPLLILPKPSRRDGG